MPAVGKLARGNFVCEKSIVRKGYVFYMNICLTGITDFNCGLFIYRKRLKKQDGSKRK